MRDGAKIKGGALLRMLTCTPHRGQGLDMRAAAFATGPESYVWIAAPRLASVALMLELLLAVTLTFTIIVCVHASEVE
jgi:hypothetical protein